MLTAPPPAVERPTARLCPDGHAVQFSNFDPQFVQNRLLSSSTSAPQSVHTKGSSRDPRGSERPQAPQNR